MRILRPAILVSLAALTSCHSSSSGPTAPPGSPVAPSQLKATQSGNTVRLSWADNSDDEVSFQIRRSSRHEEWHDRVEVKADQTTYVDENLNWSTTYYYTVCATNDKGSSLDSGEAKVDIPDPPRGPGCAVILGARLTQTSRPLLPANARVEDRDRLWMVSVHDGEEEVVDRAGLPRTRQTAELEGHDHRISIQIDENDQGLTTSNGPGKLIIDFQVQFTLDEDADFTELRLLLHDLELGDYASNGTLPSQREETIADLPFPGVVLIEKQRVYFGRMVLDRETSTYDARMGGVWVARDVPMENVLVTPILLVK